jgi:basic membrane lipoprotein Med (substrate-binding protein (PBP1-ABC) superfamily)
MMRNPTAAGIAAVVLAGLAGTGSALAAPTHAAKPLAGAVSSRDSSNDRSFRENGSIDKLSKDHSSPDRVQETQSSDRSLDG